MTQAKIFAVQTGYFCFSILFMPDNKTLLHDLSQQVDDITARAKRLQSFTEQQLNMPPAADKWSVAQVIAHLVHYNAFYLPKIEEALLKNNKHGTSYTPGWLGNYFTKLMQPLPDGQLSSKMKAPAAAVPPTQLNGHSVLEIFIAQQEQLAKLLQQAAGAHLGKIRIVTSLSTLLRLKLGDTFRFLVAHQQRHFVQIRNVLAQTPVITV